MVNQTRMLYLLSFFWQGVDLHITVKTEMNIAYLSYSVHVQPQEHMKHFSMYIHMYLHLDYSASKYCNLIG